MNGVTVVIQDNMKCCIHNKIRRGRVNGKERFSNVVAKFCIS